MEYQKMINLLENTPNQLTKFRTKNWVKINNKSHRAYNVGQIKFKTSILRYRLCDYSDVYIHVKGNITVPNTGITVSPSNRNKSVLFKDCASFSDCISEVNNKEIVDAKDIDVVMSMYNLIEYSDNNGKIFGSLW